MTAARWVLGGMSVILLAALGFALLHGAHNTRLGQVSDKASASALGPLMHDRIAAAANWFNWFGPSLPPGFVAGNGRVEATEVQVATKIAGRVASIRVQEGDAVASGQLLAEMDTKVLKAELRAAEAEVQRMRAAKQQAIAQLAQRKSELNYAVIEYRRALALSESGAGTRQRLDSAINARDTATAGIIVSQAAIEQADAAIGVARAQVDSLQSEIDDSRLTAPVDGRVLYRLAEPGEVLPAGGRVATLIDVNDLHMTIFLAEREAGRIRIGGEARIVVDAFPNNPVPAEVAFVAPEAQFTPKEVETPEERQKLMFRIKLKARADYGTLAKPGMPGMGYVRIDAAAPWPADLR